MSDYEDVHQRRRARRHALLQGASYYDGFLDLMVVREGGGTDLLHERVHVLDHVSTTYGHLVDQVHRVAARGWGQLLKEARDLGTSIPCPLSRMLDAKDEDDDIIGRLDPSLVDFVATSAPTFDVIYGLCEAMQGHKIRIATSAPALGGLSVLDHLSAGPNALPRTIDELEGLPNWTGPEALNPVFEWRIGDRQFSVEIGARCLLEGRAMIIESVLHDDNEFFLRALDVKKPEYIAGLGAMMGDRESGRAFYSYLALSDLALMGPTTLPFARMREGRNWRQVHPGYRFQQLLDHYDSIGDYDEDEDPFEYQSKFTRRLGWVDPRDLLECATRVEGDDRRAIRFRNACKCKLESPEIFFVGRVTEDADALVKAFDDFAAIEVWRMEDETYEASIDANRVDPTELLQQIGEAYLFDLGDCMMEFASPMNQVTPWLEAFEPRFALDNDQTLRAFFNCTFVGNVEFIPFA